MRKAALATALVLACAPAARAADPVQPVEVLSEPGKVSRWAFVAHATIARREPAPDARTVARLHLRTQDRTGTSSTTSAAGGQPSARWQYTFAVRGHTSLALSTSSPDGNGNEMR